MVDKQGRDDEMIKEKVRLIEETGKVTQKGQVTIPQAIRNGLNIEEGDRLKFTLQENGEAKIEVIKRRKLSNVFGILGKPPKNSNMPTEHAIRISRRMKGSEWFDEAGD
jgi:AbrB family looped-hinge helix DNA binding protein